MARPVALLAAVLLASCADEPTPEEQKLIDDAAVAAVEQANAQVPPVEEVRPEIITDADVAEAGIEGEHCTFMPGTNSGPRLIARPLDAFIKLDGEVLRLAADAGSLELAGGTRVIYNGRAIVVRLAMQEGEGTVTILDPHHREVYSGTGTVACVAGPRAPENPEQAAI